MQSVKKAMTTSSLGTVLPQFVEDYGSDKKIDLTFSPSHDLFKQGFKNAKISGLFMDKNGNF